MPEVDLLDQKNKVIYNSGRILYQPKDNEILHEYVKQPFWYKLLELPKGRKVEISMEGNLFQYFGGLADVNNAPILFPKGEFKPNGTQAAPLRFFLLVRKKDTDGGGIIEQIDIDNGGPTTYNSGTIGGDYDSDVEIFFSAADINFWGTISPWQQSEIYVGRIQSKPPKPLLLNHDPKPLQYSYKFVK